MSRGHVALWRESTPALDPPGDRALWGFLCGQIWAWSGFALRISQISHHQLACVHSSVSCLTISRR